MALALSTIQAIAARKGNEWVYAQVNQKCPTFKALDKESSDGQVGILNIQSGGLNSVAVTADGGTINYDNDAPTQILVKPSAFVGGVTIGGMAAEIVKGKKDSVNIVKNHIDNLGRNLARSLGTATLSKTVGTVLVGGTISAGAVTVVVDSGSGFRIGSGYTWNDNGTRNANVFTVTSKTKIYGGFQESVTFSCSTTLNGSVITANQDSFEVRDINGKDFVSLEELAGSATVYGAPVSDAGWVGNTIDASDGYVSGDLLRQLQRDVAEASQAFADLTIMDHFQFHELEQTQVDDRRYMDGHAPMDPYGKNADKPAFGGRKVLIDPCCHREKIFSIVSDDVSYFEFKKFSPWETRKDDDALQHKISMFGMYNLKCTKRASVGMITNMQALAHA